MACLVGQDRTSPRWKPLKAQPGRKANWKGVAWRTIWRCNRIRQAGTGRGEGGERREAAAERGKWGTGPYIGTRLVSRLKMGGRAIAVLLRPECNARGIGTAVCQPDHRWDEGGLGGGGIPHMRIGQMLRGGARPAHHIHPSRQKPRLGLPRQGGGTDARISSSRSA